MLVLILRTLISVTKQFCFECVFACVCFLFKRGGFSAVFFCLLKPVKYCILMMAGLEGWYFFLWKWKWGFKSDLRDLSVTDTFIRKYLIKKNKTWYFTGCIICNLIKSIHYTKQTLLFSINCNKNDLSSLNTSYHKNLRSSYSYVCAY